MLIRKIIVLFLSVLLIANCSLCFAENADGMITINLSTASDEELSEVAELIKAEQRSRMKTRIQFEPAEVMLKKGAIQKVVASIIDLPDGVEAGEFKWSSSDETVASCKNGTVKVNEVGNAVITCSTVLSDGSEVSGEFAVTGIIPVRSISFTSKKMEVMAGDVISPKITFIPEDASVKSVNYKSSDEKVVMVNEDGTLKAGLNGKSIVTATTNDGSNKTARLEIVVTKMSGYDEELTFQGLEWGSDSITVADKLKEMGMVASEKNLFAHYPPSFYHWPENDLLFANLHSWHDLPVAFTDQKKGVAYMYIEPLKKVGGYTPNTVRLYFLDSIDEDGSLSSERDELCGIYIHFDNKHERGADIFVDLLTKMESQYGEFTRYISKNLNRKFHRDLYEAIKSSMKDAKTYKRQDMGKDISLATHAICTLHGKNNTGIMLMIGTNEEVTLFFGKTDTLGRIEKIQKILEDVPDDKEDLGI